MDDKTLNALSSAIFVSRCTLAGEAVDTDDMVAGAIVLGVFVAYAAMFGFDKFKQTLEQLGSIKSNK